ncbi:NEMP family [Dillenia turbinata]|uniref:NEMP family n=1 Tax=Dillenia turbinata TaxID=194707 RepID=A0AAN8Z1P1_9MAGN
MALPNSSWLPSRLLFFFVFFFTLLTSHLSVSSDVKILVASQSVPLKLSPGLPMENSPAFKPKARVACERVKIQGCSRIKDLRKYAHSLKVNVTQQHESIRQSNVEVCLHRNSSLGLGMCTQGKWEKLTKGSWSRSLSPFGDKFMDICAGTSLDALEVSAGEVFLLHRVIFLAVGLVLLTVASSLSKSLVFYYSSAMAIGTILVVLMVLFQIGLGTVLLSYLPRLLHSVLMDLGISEDMYYPVCFWVVRKMILTEDGSIDISVSQFVAWSIRFVAFAMIVQSSLDPVLAMEAFFCCLIFSALLRKIFRLRSLRHLYKMVKRSRRRLHIANASPYGDSYDEYAYTTPRPADTKFSSPRSGRFSLASCNNRVQGYTRTPPSGLSDSATYYSTFHDTPERKKFSKEQWDKFTKDSTKKALEELVSSPDFNKWAVANAERITLTPKQDSSSSAYKRRRWFFWS